MIEIETKFTPFNLTLIEVLDATAFLKELALKNILKSIKI